MTKFCLCVQEQYQWTRRTSTDHNFHLLHFLRKKKITENNWLNVVHYSLSTRAGTLVFAYETKIIVLSNKWDLRTRQFKYSITWSDELERFDDITAVLCLPIAGDADEVCF